MNPSQLRRRFAALAVTITTLGTIALSAGPANASLLGPVSSPGATTSSVLINGTVHVSYPRMRG